MTGQKCPVCGKFDFEEEWDGYFDSCDVCGWENDPIQLDSPDYEGGANALSLNQFKVEYEAAQKGT
jgi:hypothetical protein